MSQLGTIDELPKKYLDGLTANNVAPLWPSLRPILPYGLPDRQVEPTIWRYDTLRPLMLEAGELTPIEKAERRVLMLANPGLADRGPIATPGIFIGMQMILPGEVAPNHRHSPSAVRLIVEGDGAYTTVEGERCPMEKGDLILTPSNLWHEHGHNGDAPMIWMDALDFPLLNTLDVCYSVEGADHVARNAPDASQTTFRRAGLLPYATLGQARKRYPMFRYPWAEIRPALEAYAAGVGPADPVQLAYVNPQTGEECMPILGFSALMLRPGETLRTPLRSASAVLHIIEGEGQVSIDDTDFDWAEGDTVAIPSYAEVAIANGSNKTPAFVFMVDDAPMQRKLGFYEERSGE